MLLFLWVFLSDMFFIQFFSYFFGKIVSDFVIIYCNYSHGYFLFDVIKGFICCLTWIGRIDSCGFFALVVYKSVYGYSIGWHEIICELFGMV
jgi:hypothetical protein